MSTIGVERRRYRRTYLPIAASLFTKNTKLGDYLLCDLSASGALFIHGPADLPVQVGMPVRAVLVGCGVDGLAVGGTVTRVESVVDGSARIAVEFHALSPSVEDALQDLVLQTLAEEGERAILIVHPEPLVLATVAADVIALGRRTLLATTPLEMIRWLCLAEPMLDTVLVHQAWTQRLGREVLGILREEFPAVHVIALGDATERAEIAQALDAASGVTFLEAPWSPSELRASVENWGAPHLTSAPPAA